MIQVVHIYKKIKRAKRLASKQVQPVNEIQSMSPANSGESNPTVNDTKIVMNTTNILTPASPQNKKINMGSPNTMSHKKPPTFPTSPPLLYPEEHIKTTDLPTQRVCPDLKRPHRKQMYSSKT